MKRRIPMLAAALLAALGLAAPRPALSLSKGAAHPQDAAATDEPAGPPPAPRSTFYATATVRERPVDSATATVSVLPAAVAESTAALSVFEVLPFVPGLTVLSGGTRGGLSAVQIRGGDPNFTRVLVDGVPVNDGTYQIGEVFDVEALPADGAARVEVVRGPLSAHYGSTGLAGAVQVITRLGDGPPSALSTAYRRRRPPPARRRLARRRP